MQVHSNYSCNHNPNYDILMVMLTTVFLLMVQKNSMCDGPMKYLAVDVDGFPIDPKESTDVVSNTISV